MSIKLLRDLSNAFGPSGDEGEVREILRNELESHADEVRVDMLGNILFYHNGKDSYPRIMLSAHMDEVGVFVTFVEGGGFLRFETVGGIPSSILPGQRLLLKGNCGNFKGVIGTKPPHLMSAEEQNKATPVEDLFIDVGAENCDKAKAKGMGIGTLGVYDTEFVELGDGYVRGKAFDDRAGCAVLAEVFRELRDSPYNFVAVGSVQEELGMRGAHTATWHVEPDYGLALEGTFAADVPGTRPDRMSASLKCGPVITIRDRSVVTHPSVLKALVDVGQEKDIPFQFKKVPAGGTDAGVIHLTRGGVASGVVSVPCRYIHGPAAVTHIDDLKNTVCLVAEFIRRISAGET